MSSPLDPGDLEQLRARGIAPEEVRRQLALLTGTPRFARLVRPCTVGDGIHRVGDQEAPALLASHAAAAAAGRFTKFVPASGAATRMFRDLIVFVEPPRSQEDLETVRAGAERDDAASRALLRFLDELSRFPFHDRLATTLAGRGDDLAALADAGRFVPILEGLLAREGLGYMRAPKALLAFHRYRDETRTAFEEHLVEAVDYARDADGVTRLHFTVSPEHRAGFAQLFDTVREVYETRLEARFRVDYSSQKPSTDTVAVDSEGRLFRDASGRLVFRPAGHGALIENLSELDADLVYVKNIDNVQPDRVKPVVSRWKRLLGGYLVELQHRAARLLGRLRDRTYERHLARAATFASTRLHVELDGHLDRSAPDVTRAWLVDRLSRPLRVCGVVANTGEPGGGPFWVRDRQGQVSLQLVEAAQVDRDDPDQRATLSRATHFSPVDLVCTLKDLDERPFDLTRFVDPDAVITTEKASGGRSLRALERPGLWNGAMAGWNTVFVEVPLETFTPVKTVFDLLRPEHRAIPDPTSG